MKLEWHWHPETGEYYHLSCWRASVGGLKLQIRYVAGCDYNVAAERDQKPLRYYEAHLSFVSREPNKTCDHAICIHLYRPNYEACMTDLEQIISDLILAFFGALFSTEG